MTAGAPRPQGTGCTDASPQGRRVRGDRVRPRAAARGLFPIISPLPAGGKGNAGFLPESAAFPKKSSGFPQKAVDAPLDL